MNTALRSMALTAVLATATVFAPFLSSASGAAPSGGAVTSTTRSRDTSDFAPSAEFAQTWICDKSDSICGLDDARMLSKPCKVDYDALLKATPEMKKITNDKIDPSSSEGIQLKQKATDRIRDKTDSVRQSQGYCSAWKTIRHQDGRTIPDITDLVKAQL